MRLKRIISSKLIQFILLKDILSNLKQIIYFLNFKTENYCTNTVSAELKGGLGNQLFQIANTLAYSWKYRLTPVFKKIKKSQSMGKSKSVYWKTVFRKLPVYKNLPSELITINENKFIYHKIPSPDQIPDIKKKNGIIFEGYFQSVKYFDNYRKGLLKYLYFISSSKKKYLKKKYLKIYDKNIISIALHIRRSDYLKVPNVFTNLLETNYYKKSITYFQERLSKSNYQFIIFSDDQEWSKSYIKTTFPNLNSIFPIEKDYLELYLMSCCNHQIIANSSFSWWGAYLNRNPEKIIIAPKKWFGPDGPVKWDSLYGDGWIKM